MLHSYLKTETVYQGKVYPLTISTKTNKGEITSEGKHMEEMDRLSTKIDWKNQAILMHSEEERKERKKSIFQGVNRNFAGKVVPFEAMKKIFKID